MIIIWITSNASVFTAQNCINYPDINGSTCIDCTPTGWSPTGSPDIIDPTGYYNSSCTLTNLSGASPSGGNMALMAGNEAITTTIIGLDPNIEYSFAIYWEGLTAESPCLLPFSNGNLDITIDGTTYSFSDAIDWTLAEVCFTPSSSTVDIQLAHSGALFSVIVVDSAPCSAVTPCCELILDVDQLNYSVCPGEPFNLLASYAGEIGNVTIDWSSTNADALNYLSSTNELNPVFLFPESNSNATQSYKYSLSIEDDNCLAIEQCIEVTVEASSIPIFELDICESDGVLTLPNTSNDGYSGMWTGDFNLENQGGNFIDFTFFIDPNQGNCLESYVYSFFVAPAIDPIFGISLEYCELDNTEYNLTNISDNGITGFWSEDTLIPSQLGVGLYAYEFIPTDECAANYILTIEIEAATTLNFDLEETYCVDSINLIPPQESLEGIAGTWSPMVIDLSTPDNIQATFTPSNANLCISDFTYNFIVTQQTTLSFNLPLEYCQEDNIITLPSTSLNSIDGTWDLANINLNDLQSSSAIFTPNSSENCTEIFQYDFEVIQAQEPIFNLANSYCIADSQIILSITSINGVLGSWDVEFIDLTLPQNNVVTFTPSANSCATPYTHEFVVENPSTPSFDLNEFICSSVDTIFFPNTSVEDISGSWESAIVIIDTLDSDIVTNTFTPDIGVCAVPLLVSLEVKNIDNIDIIATDPSQCNSADGSINFIGNLEDFEISVDGGIEWSSIEDLINLDDGQYNFIIRTSSLSTCTKSYDIRLESPELPILENIVVVNNTDCQNANGCIEVIDQQFGLEYSIDQNAWTEVNEFCMLPEGNYTVSIRFINNPECVLYREITIDGPSLFSLDTLDLVPIDSCDLANGQVSTSASPMAEYSIDKINWNSNPLFQGLSAGSYFFYGRSEMYPTCIDSLPFEILSLVAPQITEVVVTRPSLCDTKDGTILILSSVNDIEYSIDNGFSWSTSNFFENLEPGDYTIVIRLANNLSCTDDQVVNIDQVLDVGEIEVSIIKELTSCDSEDGSIEINTIIEEPEFSLDASTWQADNVFDGLSFGLYTVYARSLSNQNCIGTRSIEIIQPACPCNELDLEYEINNSSCGKANGSILITSIGGVEPEKILSIEWNTGSTSEEISNLNSGEYVVLITHSNNCTYEETIKVQPSSFTFGLQSFDQSCDALGYIEVTEIGESQGEFQYSLDNVEFQSDNLFFNLSSEDYQVYVDNFFDCSGVGNTNIDFDNNLEFSLPEIAAIEVGESVFLNPLINIATIDSFEWSNAEYILNPGELIAEVAPDQTTEFTLLIYFGTCIESRTIKIEVIESLNVYLPNVMNTSSSSGNNIFYPKGKKSETIIGALSVFDRWGNRVFYNQDFNLNDETAGWDGTFKGKKVEQGVYVYLLELHNTSSGSDKNTFKQGNITIIH